MNSKHFAILAGIISIFAGIHLASLQSAASNSLISSIAAYPVGQVANGMGWYFIARGVYMISLLYPVNQEDKDTPDV